MADWLQPTIDSLKVDVLDVLKLRDLDAITLAEGPTNPPIGAKRWHYATKTFQEYTAAGWVDLVISLAGGGTGGSGSGGAFGTMAYQNSDNVYITAGTIAEAAIKNDTLLARVADNEAIAGAWGFNQVIVSWGGLKIQPGQPSAGLNRISIAESVNSAAPGFIQAYEPGVSDKVIIVSNNYYGIDGGQSGRINPSVGGSFIRLGQGTITFSTISATGVVSDGRMTIQSDAIVTAVHIHAGGGAAGGGLVRCTGPNGGVTGLEMYDSGAKVAQIVNQSNVIYFDANAVTWRTTTASAVLAQLNSSGTFSAYTLQPTSGFIYNSGGTQGIYLVPNQVQTFGDNFFATNSANTSHLFHANSTGLNVYGAFLVIGGVSPNVGSAITIQAYTGHAYFYCTGPAGHIFFSNRAGSAHSCIIYDGGNIAPATCITLPNGSAATCSLRIGPSSTTGAYYNPANGTCEFGSAMSNDTYRSVMRTFYVAGAEGGKIDFLTGSSILVTFGPYPYARFGAYVSPSAANTFYCAEPNLAWYQVTSYTGYITTSDIRVKDIHSTIPDDILDLIDSVEPLITSFKESDIPENPVIPREEYRHRFPSFSAQDIRSKVDERLGVKTVYGDERLGIEYGRLTPLLWAAIRRLNARLKALEGEN